MAVNTAGIYIHIPFCFAKCTYCSFVSVPKDGRMQAYVDALCTEIERSAHAWQGAQVQSVFIGGGTPSVLPPQAIGRILQTVGASYTLADQAEITCEANPESFDAARADAWARAGVSRISFGVQALQPEMLKRLGRPHTFADFEKAVRTARQAGITNLNGDLIYALPGQDMGQWIDSLQAVADTGVQHVSCYALQVEEGTPLFDRVQRGALTLCDEDTAADMWDAAALVLGQYGLTRYEISNYARPGYESWHNQQYWRNGAYAGFGVAAHGAQYRGGQWMRMANTESIDGYIAAVRRGESPRAWEQTIGKEEEMFETVMLQTRMVRGLDKAAFHQRFGCAFDDVYPRAIARAVDLEMAENSASYFALNDCGMALQNGVLQWFLSEATGE